ncbi:MAG: HisA/HisF family protein [Archaeoglobaceae archaeon]|nr:HisA/HisF family protein [Archaeoglobaceae archaeon]MDW7990096.1 HisA/HisF family protein [Archaeoglobaceae archaeon]
MKIFFVLDIKKGIAVLAERGEREKYMPISYRSSILKTNDPIAVVKNLKPRYLYVADLDRISGIGNNFETLKSISKLVEEMIADCGFRNADELEKIDFKPVVGTETFDITKINRKCYVSLDFRDSFLEASGKFHNWVEVVEFLNELELEGVIVMNMRKIGSLTPDFDLTSKILDISENPVFIGGGIGSISDLEKLRDMGCKGVLVATAVHKKILPLDLIQKGHFI